MAKSSLRRIGHILWRRGFGDLCTAGAAAAVRIEKGRQSGRKRVAWEDIQPADRAKHRSRGGGRSCRRLFTRGLGRRWRAEYLAEMEGLYCSSVGRWQFTPARRAYSRRRRSTNAMSPEWRGTLWKWRRTRRPKGVWNGVSSRRKTGCQKECAWQQPVRKPAKHLSQSGTGASVRRQSSPVTGELSARPASKPGDSFLVLDRAAHQHCPPPLSPARTD